MNYDGLILFGGFGGVECGLRAAGFENTVSIEYDDEIAAVARLNGHNTITADVLDIDPYQYIGVKYLHASPPCPSFSLANSNRGETEADLALARKVADFVRIVGAKVITLENVYLYRTSQSWAIIRDALYAAGYWFDITHLNSADFGVPQTRKRMIVRAIRGAFVPHLPPPERWRGWYEAVEDIVDTFPDDNFAPWQEKLLPDDMRSLIVNGTARQSGGVTTREAAEPMFTLTSTMHTRSPLRAFLLGQGSRSAPVAADEPAQTITSNRNQRHVRAFVLNGTPNDNGSHVTIREGSEPFFTVISSVAHKPSRAWLDVGRVARITVRGLARFQSLPDGYQLPDDDLSLACRGIGNAVPSLQHQKLFEQLARYL